MKNNLYLVDAFTAPNCLGNPAAVCILDRWIEDRKLQSLATENNLSETAFLLRNEGGFDIRWFTPTNEVALCGHATLASAFVLFTCRQWPAESICFQTRASGQLVVARRGELLEMDFPARPVQGRAVPAGLAEALGVAPREVLGAGDFLLVVLESEQAVQGVRPDFGALERVAFGDVVITARGDRSDFVSRCFAPRDGIPEDPVTGSAHCVLIPYWAGVLRKNELHAFQVSKRGGELFCTQAGERVRIAGRALLKAGPREIVI